MLPYITLQGTNISHLEKRKIIFKSDFWWDILVPRRVPIWIKGCTSHNYKVCTYLYAHIMCVWSKNRQIICDGINPILRECQLACTLGTMYYVPPKKKIQELREMTHNIDRVRFVLRPWCNCSWKFLPYFLRAGSTMKVPPRPSKPMVETLSFVYMLLSQTMSYISDVMQNPRKHIYLGLLWNHLRFTSTND